MSFWACNIGRRGRWLRFACGAILLLAAGLFCWQGYRWPGAILAAAALFTWFEAMRGWCVLRALGMRTRY
jgi:hypothetical protein